MGFGQFQFSNHLDPAGNQYIELNEMNISNFSSLVLDCPRLHVVEQRVDRDVSQECVDQRRTKRLLISKFSVQSMSRESVPTI